MLTLTTQPEMLLLLILHVIVCMTSAAEPNENATSTSTDQYDVKKVDVVKKIYSGKRFEPPPENVTVTEEVWFDIAIPHSNGTGNHFKERITISCFGDLTPITCLNFISLAKGYSKGKTLMAYKGTNVQKIVRDFMIHLGDVKSKYANGDSIFGTSFKDESFALSHSRAGWVGMANYGPDTNGSQFYILLGPARWLDGKHVIFGKVISGMDAVRRLAEEETGPTLAPMREIIVEEAGIIGIKTPYILTAKQLDTDGDIDTGRK